MLASKEEEGTQQSRGVWVKLGESGGVAPCKRQGHRAVSYQGGMYLFGGFTDEGLCAPSLYLYSFQRDEWSVVKAKKGEAPSARHSHTAVVYKNSLFIFGGAGDKGALDASLYSFNFVQRAWKKVSVKGEAPTGRWGHTAVVHEDSMYLFGGFNESSVTNQLYKFDFAKSRWKEITGGDKVPSPRHLHSAVVYKGGMYTFAGFSNVNHSDLHRFDFKKEEWEEVRAEGGGSKGRDRRGHVAVVIGGEVMAVHGGRGKEGPLSDILLFNFEKGEWEEGEGGEGCPTGRYFHSAVVWEGSIWLFGGLGQSAPTETKSRNLNDFYSFSLEGVVGSEESVEEGGGRKRSVRGSISTSNRKDRFDILTRAPPEISIAILLHMDIKTLGIMASVSKAWNNLSEDDAVWRTLFLGAIHEEYKESSSTSSSSKGKEKKKVESSWKDKVKALYEDPFHGLNAYKIDDISKYKGAQPTMKVVIVGGGGTGKSAMTIMFVQNHFVDEYDPTIEDSYRKLCMISNKEYFLDILDTAGPEEFSAMRDQYIRYGEGFIVNYAINSRSSFNELEHHVGQIERVKDDRPFKLLITGNKCDLDKQREVSYEEGSSFAKSKNYAFLETSAKSGHNIDKAFLGIARMVLQLNQADGAQPPRGRQPQDKRCLIC